MPRRIATLGVPADLLRRRPDIRAAERRVASQSARVGVATADLYPSFTLFGTIGLSAASSGDLFQSGSRIFTLGSGFSWKLFQGGAVRSQIKAEDARLEQALLSYRQAVLGALREVENALVSFDQLQKQAAILRRAAAAARRTLKLSVDLYKEGLADFQRVLDAQRTLFENGDQLVQAQGNAAGALVSLYKALGGGWRLTPPKTGPAKSPANESAPAIPRGFGLTPSLGETMQARLRLTAWVTAALLVAVGRPPAADRTKAPAGPPGRPR